MSQIRLTKIRIENYRSFGQAQTFVFPESTYMKPTSIIGYNNSGKTNLINAILYGIGEKYVGAKTFEKSDLHNLSIENQIKIQTRIEATSYMTPQGEKSIAGDYLASTIMEDGEIKSKVSPTFFGANKHYNVFYINFHNIKDEISTKKTSWGNLTSFLAKHIEKIIESDEAMLAKKEAFKTNTKNATVEVLRDSALSSFINTIKTNYSKNLRNNSCEVDFGLPEYADIFLQMVFRIGLNGDNNNLLPIGHFGDGYISMFVMAIIQSIAESNSDDKCLFLFEEPESFLHENHQEYFYKMVLCHLAEKGHQVIYTTHSDKMLDVFDTKSIIRVEFNEQQKRTEKKYNKIDDFNSDENEIVTIDNFNSFIKSVEPNLNKILFSRKVILVEGPNDLMSYQFAIRKKVDLITGDPKYANAYLNFLNICIIPHHGKATAILLVQLCKHFGLNYFVINDWDFEEDFIAELAAFESDEQLKASQIYLMEQGENRASTRKGMVTTNWKIIHHVGLSNMHFNLPKLERVIGYDYDDKDSLKIWQRLNVIGTFQDSFFPNSLSAFLELDDLQTSIDFATINSEE